MWYAENARRESAFLGWPFFVGLCFSFGLGPGLGVALSSKPWVGFLIAPALGFIGMAVTEAFVFAVAVGAWPTFASAFDKFLSPAGESGVIVLCMAVLPLAFHWIRIRRGRSWRIPTCFIQLGGGLIMPLIRMMESDAAEWMGWLFGCVILAATHFIALELALRSSEKDSSLPG